MKRSILALIVGACAVAPALLPRGLLRPALRAITSGGSASGNPRCAVCGAPGVNARPYQSGGSTVQVWLCAVHYNDPPRTMPRSSAEPIDAGVFLGVLWAGLAGFLVVVPAFVGLKFALGTLGTPPPAARPPDFKPNPRRQAVYFLCGTLIPLGIHLGAIGIRGGSFLP